MPGIPPEAADTFMPTMINTVFPPFTAAIVLCAVLAAIMSTVIRYCMLRALPLRDFLSKACPGRF